MTILKNQSVNFSNTSNLGSLRMNAATRSSIGSFFKAEQVTTAVFKNGQQMQDNQEISKVISSWYAYKAEQTGEFEKVHETLLQKVVTELMTVDTMYWGCQNLSKKAMIESLSNKLSRVALTTAPIIPTQFRIGEDSYEIKTIRVSVNGPNPLIPDNWDKNKTCQYSNARNANDVNSYWPEHITHRLIDDLTRRARIELVYLDESEQEVSENEGLPAVMVGGKVFIAYKKDVSLKPVDNKRKMSFFKMEPQPIIKPNVIGNKQSEEK